MLSGSSVPPSDTLNPLDCSKFHSRLFYFEQWPPFGVDGVGTQVYSSPLRRCGIGGVAVALYRLMQGQAFSPEDVERLSAAYEAALKLLDLPNRADPVTEIVAKRIIEAAQRGLIDPAKICAAAIKDLGIP
jgi:hypothetical protein